MYARDTVFEESMLRGIEYHANGDHYNALVARTDAFWQSSNEVQAARALRDAAASHGYLDEFDRAEEAAVASVELLKTSNNNRELGASYDRLGRVQVLMNMEAEHDGTHVFDPAISAFTKAKELLHPKDQYFVNMIGRAATSSVLYGSRISGIFESLRAVKSSLRSETRRKHLGVALSSLGLSLLLKSPVKNNRVNTKAFKLAKQIMH